MMFWIAILVGALFVWLAVRVGFYETWVLFFNIVVSIYVSVFLSPILAELARAPGGAASYHVALCLTVLAGGCFALLQGLSFVFLTGQYHIPFPRVFDVLLSGVLGFAAGFLTLSFVALVLTVTPLAENRIAGVFGLAQQSEQANLVCLTRCCDLIHSFARFDHAGNTTQAAVQRLLETTKVGPRPGKTQSDANDPPQPQPPKEAATHKGRRIIEYDIQ
ncbi:MAG: CvpA family protein [Phycisphaerae bacterium]|nr:CvpA family protein [Phycisphaerae bacterium]